MLATPMTIAIGRLTQWGRGRSILDNETLNINCRYTLEKHHDRCILYEDCELHDKSCDTCATGQKYCSHGLKGIMILQQLEHVKLCPTS